ncbi:MAG: hypothetical protein ACLR3S_05300 [Clostridium fessum]
MEQGEKAKIRKTDEICPEMDGMEDEEIILHRIGTNGRLSVNWVWTAASSR